MTNPITLDGSVLYQAFTYGSRKVIRRKEHLNRINVFPVPDGDTGSNLSSTLQSIMENTKASRSAGETLKSIAEAALDGARGNSGIIFAQFLNGLSEALEHAQAITQEAFGAAVRTAARRAYEAISNPVEGTMLTVMKEWSEAVVRLQQQTGSFQELFHRSCDAALESLRRTPEKLSALRQAKVLDAGAQGFVDFLHGMRDFFSGDLAPELLEAFDEIPDRGEGPGEAPDVHSFGEDAAIPFRYCCEALIRGETIDPGRLREDLRGSGDSLIVAGGKRRARVHIHTSDPEPVFARISLHGSMQQQKVDDMVRQFAVIHRRKYPIALVTDSTCDLPREILDRYQIHVVPVTLAFGEEEYIDRITMMPDTFYDRQRSSIEPPRTSQPNPGMFRKLYSFLAEHYDSIIALHISGPLSGTMSTSLQEASRIAESRPEMPLSVIDARHTTGALGLLVLHAAEEIARGRRHEEVVEAIRKAIPATDLFVAVPTIRHMVRSGRVGGLRGMLGKLLGIRPIVVMNGDEGTVELQRKSFSHEANIRHLMDRVAEIHRHQPLAAWGVAHAHSVDRAREVARELESRLGKAPEFIVDASPALGLHTGWGTIALVTRRGSEAIIHGGRT